MIKECEIRAEKREELYAAIRAGLEAAERGELVGHEVMESLFMERRLNTLRLMERFHR